MIFPDIYFSMISAPSSQFFQRKSTITRSICGMSNSSFVEHHSHCLDDLVFLLQTLLSFTLPPKIEGYEVTSSTGITGIPRFFIKSSVPPVE
jgi:hypothetical protein